MKAWGLLLGVVLAQGLLASLLPQDGMGPDLFLAYALWLAGRNPFFLALPYAWGVGLLQDLLGFGLLGLHALGLTLGAYAYLWAGRFLPTGTTLGGSLALLLAQLAKWLGFFLLAYLLRLDLPPLALGLLTLEYFLTLPFFLLLRRV